MDKTIITVTGATGYIASWIVRDLLQEGHEVRITVRDKSNTAKYQHLLDIAKTTSGSLNIYEADLMKEGSFDAAISGAVYVMHTASPFVLNDKDDPQKNLVDPAVKGTKTVLDSVNKSKSVKRVVLTSSLAAIYGDNIDLINKGTKVLDETIWNTSSSLHNGAYSYSKTEAEKAGWAMMKAQDSWDLVTIHPGFVLGPSLTKRKDSTSINTLLRVLTGELRTGVPDLGFIFSDVRDISKGHLKAAFTEDANGRYIIANEAGNLLDIARIISDTFGDKYRVPKRMIPKWLIWLISPTLGLTRKYVTNNIGYEISADHSRSLADLDMTYHSLKETIIDHVSQLEADKLI